MKRILILSVFLFGWLILFEACNPCTGGSSNIICVQRNNIQALAYNQNNGMMIEPINSLKSSDLIIEVLQDVSEETCMLSFHSGALMACSPPPIYSYNFDLEVVGITIVSNANVTQDYYAGKDLSPLMEIVRIETPVPGEPMVVRFNEPTSAFLYSLYSANSIPNGYDPEYDSESYRAIRFKENSDIAKGEHTFTINWVLSDDSVLSSSVAVTIE